MKKNLESVLKVDLRPLADRAEKFFETGYSDWVTRLKDDKWMHWGDHGLIVSGGKFGGGYRGRGFSYKKAYLLAAMVAYYKDGVTYAYYKNRPCIKRKLKTLGLKYEIIPRPTNFIAYDDNNCSGIKVNKYSYKIPKRSRTFIGL